MIQRWRSGKAGCLWVTWKAVCTTKLVRISWGFFLGEMLNHPPSCGSTIFHLCFRIVLGELSREFFQDSLFYMADALLPVISGSISSLCSYQIMLWLFHVVAGRRECQTGLCSVGGSIFL